MNTYSWTKSMKTPLCRQQRPVHLRRYSPRFKSSWNATTPTGAHYSRIWNVSWLRTSLTLSSNNLCTCTPRRLWRLRPMRNSFTHSWKRSIRWSTPRSTISAPTLSTVNYKRSMKSFRRSASFVPHPPGSATLRHSVQASSVKLINSTLQS